MNALPKWRRKYHRGKCDDCGWLKSVTVIRWWLGGTYTVCAQCIKPYRKVILTHHANH